MAIETLDALIDALGNTFSNIQIDKASFTSTAAAGQYHSGWRATGQPGQGAIPTTAAVPDNETTGAINFTQQTAPAKSYWAGGDFMAGTGGTTIEIHDRLAHMGGLSGTVATAQTVDLDLNALTANNVVARRGAANYSDVQWWLEWYADTGGTAVTATVNVTYNDGTSGNLTAVSLAATRRGTFLQPLNNLIPAADSGKFIRDVNTVTLSATTGTAGNFGVTATRRITGLYCPIANQVFSQDWATAKMPEVVNEACLFPIILANGTTAGAVKVAGKVIHG